jgi:hypothetical protein
VYGPASEIDLSIGESGHHFHLAAMRDSEDELLVIAFHLPDERGLFRGGSGTGGRIRQVRTSSYNFTASRTVQTISEGPIGVRPDCSVTIGSWSMPAFSR